MECIYDSHGQLVAYRDGNFLFGVDLKAFGQVWEDCQETFEDAQGEIVFNLTYEMTYYLEECRGPFGTDNSEMVLKEEDYVGEVIQDADGFFRLARNAGAEYMTVNPPFNLERVRALVTAPSCDGNIKAASLPEGYCNIHLFA